MPGSFRIVSLNPAYLQGLPPAVVLWIQPRRQRTSRHRLIGMGSIPVSAQLSIPSPHIVHEVRVHEDSAAGVSGGLPPRAVGKEDAAHLHFYSAHVPPRWAKVFLLVP